MKSLTDAKLGEGMDLEKEQDICVSKPLPHGWLSATGGKYTYSAVTTPHVHPEIGVHITNEGST